MYTVGIDAELAVVCTAEQTARRDRRLFHPDDGGRPNMEGTLAGCRPRRRRVGVQSWIRSKSPSAAKGEEIG